MIYRLQNDSSYLIRVPGTKVEWYKSEPYDACGVHGETDEFCLVEIFRYFSSLDSVDCAHCNQDHTVHLQFKNLFNTTSTSFVVGFCKIALPPFESSDQLVTMLVF